MDKSLNAAMQDSLIGIRPVLQRRPEPLCTEATAHRMKCSLANYEEHRLTAGHGFAIYVRNACSDVSG